MRQNRCLCKALRDSLNSGSSMTLGSKGSQKSTAAHRARMPWTAAKERVAAVVLHAKDKTILDGAKLVEAEDIDRMSQVDPLDVLKTAVKTYEFNTSTGKNVFQLASQLPHHGRGQRFYRKEWTEGTYEKHVTLSSVEFSRDGSEGTAYGYVTFHGESTLRPIVIANSEAPGWHVDYDAQRAVPYDSIVVPPPSIGTDVPVNPATYRLRAYPYYDAPNPEEFVEKLLKDRGVLPDPEVDPNSAAMSTPSLGDESNDGSVHVKA
ncbi:Hypothetical protein, putative [Bodo saltans]|uniref:Uncharacterized protein n=1 Tax=Bodo saltans TaxID=75058 RepID=A0A0S4JH36_BODSA|nr:Hypothetical protein, putative [Bodo saltans]|eukprot:CUG89353.1 Hypothetical protein, putative [Bodo saltans]